MSTSGKSQVPPSPSRKRATRGEKSTPQREAALPTGVKEEDLLPKRYETFTMDHDWVQWVRCSLLGLKTGATPSKEDIDTLEHFVPRAAASEPEPPEVVMDHWLPILQEHGHLAVSPQPVYCCGRLGPLVHPGGPMEASSGGSIHLCEHRAA